MESLHLLRINQSQFNFFRRSLRARFVVDMEQHVNLFFPDVYRRERPEQIRSRILAAINHAETFGLTGRSDVCKFINLKVMFGDDFFDKPNLAWAKDMLVGNSTDRMSNLYEIVIRQLQLHNR